MSELNLNNSSNFKGNNGYLLNRTKISEELRYGNRNVNNIKGYDSQGNTMLLNPSNQESVSPYQNQGVFNYHMFPTQDYQKDQVKNKNLHGQQQKNNKKN